MVSETHHYSFKKLLLYLKTFDKRQFLHSTRFQLFLFTFIINFLFISTGLASPNEGSRYLLTKTISENNSFSWPSSWVNNQTGYWFFPDFGINQGFISDKAPGLSFLLVPVYLLGKIFYMLLFHTGNTNLNAYSTFDDVIIYLLKIFLVLMASVLAVKLFDLLELLHENKKQNLLIVSIASLGSLFFLYTPTLFPSVVSTFLYVFIIYHLICFNRYDYKSDLLIAGILTGFSVVVEYGSLVMIIWFLWYLSSKDLIQNKRVPLKKLSFFLGFSFVGVLPLFFYNYVLSGNPFLTSYIFSYWVNKIEFYHELLSGLVILLFDTDRGLFILNPILFLACIGFFVPKYFKNNFQEIILITFPCLSFIIFYAKNFDPTGGMAVGPRYIIALIPLLIIGLQGWFTLSKMYAKIISVFFICISVFNSALLALTVGVFPKQGNSNPVLIEAIPNIFNGYFKPFIASLNIILFLVLVLLTGLLVILLNRAFFIQYIKKIKENPVHEQKDLNYSNNIPVQQPHSSNEKTLNLTIIGTLWLFSIFSFIFLFFGTRLLSREFYLSSKTVDITDIAFVLVFIAISILITVKTYIPKHKINFLERQ